VVAISRTSIRATTQASRRTDGADNHCAAHGPSDAEDWDDDRTSGAQIQSRVTIGDQNLKTKAEKLVRLSG
jgi:hypothetical protein